MKRLFGERRDGKGIGGAGARRLCMVATVAMAVATAALSVLTSLSGSAAMLYVVVILLAGDMSRRCALRASALCAALTLWAFFRKGDATGEDMAFLGFALAANFATTVLTVYRDRDRCMIEAQARLLQLPSDAIVIRDSEDRIVYWNKGAELLFGWAEEEAIGRQRHELFLGPLSPACELARAQFQRIGRWEGESRVTTKDGCELVIRSNWRRETLGPVGPVTIETAIDLSERKRSEAALRSRDDRYRMIFETLPVAILEHDLTQVQEALTGLRRNGVSDLRRYLQEHPEFVTQMRCKALITNANQQALTMIGVSDKADFFANLDEFLPETDTSFIACLVAIAEGETSFQAETVVTRRDSTTLPVMVMANFLPGAEGLNCVHASIVDMSERVRLQEEVDASSAEIESAARAAMIGEISASIAHEVNQPLAAVLTFVQAAQRWLDRDVPDLAEARFALSEAINSTELASKVVHRVRMLLGKAKSENEPMVLDDVLRDALRFKQKELVEHRVSVKTRFWAGGAVIEGDRILLQQAFINIIVNAMQAMEGLPAGGRLLSIESRTAGEDLVVRIADSGPGLGDLPPEDLFKAFATTKPGGMGLGLAMCRSILSAHSGTIGIRDRRSGGAVVEITLPLRSAQAVHAARIPFSAPAKPAMARLKETAAEDAR